MGQAQAPLPGLKLLRLAKGLTVKELAGQTGISQSSLFKAERTGRGSVQLSTAEKLAEFFGVTVDELLHPGEVCRKFQVARQSASDLLLNYKAQRVRSCAT